MWSYIDFSNPSWDLALVIGIAVGIIMTMCSMAIFLRVRSRNLAMKAPGVMMHGYSAPVKAETKKRKNKVSQSNSKDDRLVSLLDDQHRENQFGGIQSNEEISNEVQASFLSVMADGVLCIWHRDGSSHKDIRLAMKSNNLLVWGAPGKKPKNSIAFDSIISVVPGNDSSHFSINAKEKCCLSIICKDGYSLDIELHTVLERDGLLMGFGKAVENLKSYDV